MKSERQAMFEYLDELRDSGITNMFGARPFLMERFGMRDGKLAGEILSEWMETFSKRHPQGGAR